MSMTERFLKQSTVKDDGRPRTPVVGYCRFSCENQADSYSIEAQQYIISQYCERNGFEVVEWYVDRAYSAKSGNRPAFQRLLSDVKSKDKNFLAVIVSKSDRFSRSVSDAVTYRELLENNGVSLISASENFTDDPSGFLLYSVVSSVNEWYVRNLSAEVEKGLRARARECKHCGGTPPLGYNVDSEGYLVINESEAPTIRLIFERIANGCSYREVVKELNERKMRTKKGREFSATAVYDLLNNPKYMGRFVAFRRSKRPFNAPRNSHKERPLENQIIIDGGCPAIVSEDLWNRANASRRIMSKTLTNAKHQYLLSGLIWCEECGYKYHGNYREHPNKQYSTYRCNKQASKRNCDAKEINAKLLEKFTIENLISHFFSPEIIDVIVDELNKKLKASIQCEKEDVKAAKYSLDGLKTARNNLIDAIAEYGYNESLSAKLQTLEKQIEEFERLISEDEKGIDDSLITREEVVEQINTLKETLKDPNNIDKKKVLLRSYVDRITVGNSKITASYKLAVVFSHNGEKYNVEYRHEASTTRKELKRMYGEHAYDTE